MRTAAAAAAALDSLSSRDAQLLSTLRSGLRKWRLDAPDWEKLADILVARRAGGGKQRAAVAAGKHDPAIATLALQVCASHGLV